SGSGFSPPPQARSSASAPSKAKIEPSSEIEPVPLAKLVEVGADMGFENLLHGSGLDAELGGDQGRGTGRPVHPGVAGLSRQPEHQRLGASAIDELALELLELQPPLLRPQPLVGGPRLQEGRAATSRWRQPVL